MKSGRRAGPLCVAIVEDSPEIAELYAALIRMLGMRVGFTAGNGAEAVRAFSAAGARPDIVLIDGRMPVMSGLDALRAMKAIDPGARLIMISADEDLRDSALKAGASAFLKKPAALQEIYEAIIATGEI